MILISAVFYAATPGKEKLRVKMVVHYKKMRNDSTEYFYNPDGRISRIQNSGKTAFNTTYNYLPGIILRKYQDNAGTVGFVDTLFLNKSGMVIKTTSNNNVISPLKHQYDTSAQLIKSIHLDKAGKEGAYTSNSYSKGNKIAYTSYDASGKETGKGSYEYYTDKPNTIGNRNTGMDFAGVDSKNAEKSGSYQQTGMQPFSYTCEYKYDEQSRISIRTQYDGATGKLKDSASYTYYP